MQPKIGVVLINLGTPRSSSKRDVKQYLREFLSDSRVIDIPGWLRKLLVNFWIVPFRSKQTSHAYASIWHAELGSPLLMHTQALTTAVQNALGDPYEVVFAMRYGSPNLADVMKLLSDKHCNQLIILPLFPHYSSAATGSALEKALQCVSNWHQVPTIFCLKEFYRFPHYIKAQAAVIAPFVQQSEIILFSYHSLPWRQVKKSKAFCQETCYTNHPCPSFQDSLCYRSKCFEASALLANCLGLKQNQYRVAFQSRLGRIEWIGPSLQHVMKELIEQGIKRIAVACPSFVADCLETLEEIGIRAREEWKRLGGENLALIPCLNTNHLWVETVCNVVDSHTGGIKK